jgi:hypothetical protein
MAYKYKRKSSLLKMLIADEPDLRNCATLLLKKYENTFFVNKEKSPNEDTAQCQDVLFGKK